MKTSVALIGFMGIGKSAVGKALAEITGKDFLEMDTLIVEKAGKTIPEIFHQDGEVTFRELEMAVTRDIHRRKNTVVACGGGIVLNQINIARLKDEYVVVYLTGSPGEILRRTAGDSNRPLLDVADRTARIRELMGKRLPFYERAADFKVNTTRTGIRRVTENVIRKLKEYEAI